MLRVVDSTDDVFAFMRWLSEQPRIAVDTETTGHNLFDPTFKIRLAQVGNHQEAWVFDFKRWCGVLDEMFRKFEGRIVMHNANYDVHAFASEGVNVPWHSLDDTMIALRIAEPDQSAALKNAADRHIGAGASGSQKDLVQAFRTNKWDWASVPLDFPTYVLYAGLDVILTSRLADHPTVKRGFSSPVYGLEMEVRSIANRMERRGMRVDVEYSSKKRDELVHESWEIRQSVTESHGFSPGSTRDLGRWFLTHATPLMTEVTDSGAPSVTKAVLERIVLEGKPEAAELARNVLRMRRLEKLASSYFSNFVELSDDDDFIHAEIETLAARTGRMSIRKPGLQTLPRVSDDPETRIVRRAVIPRAEEQVLISCDSDQIELRLAAALSEDAAMIEAFETSDDFFTTSVQDVYRDPAALKSDPRRATIKTFWYASLYGAGVSKMALSAGVTEERMQDIKRGIEVAYPDFSNLSKRFEQEARENSGWVRNPYGRMLKVDEGKLYSATNYVIQSAAADVLKHSIVGLGHAGLDEYMVIPVHDELVFSVPEEDAEEISRTVEEVMTCSDFALTLTASTGPPALTWDDCK
jgi:DNA polymerase I